MPSPEPEVRLADVAAMIRSATEGIEARDKRFKVLEATLNDLMKQMHRPRGGGDFSAAAVDERAQAIGLLEHKHHASQAKRDPSLPEPSFSEEQIAEGKLAIRGLRTLMHSTSIDQVPLDQRKALSAFSLGSQGFLLAPEMSQTILSCLADESDITGLMNNVTISGASIKFLVDNEIWDVAAWACESRGRFDRPSVVGLLFSSDIFARGRVH